MKKLLSAALTAVTLAGVSQGAFAILPNVAPEIEIFMAGATAQNRALRALMINLCGQSNGGDLHIYNTAQHEAYYCTLRSATVDPVNGIPNLSVGGVAVNQARVLVHKRSQGGSAQGVNPVLQNQPVLHMAVTPANCPGAPIVPAPVPGEQTIACTSAALNTPSQAGLSDVEPGLFIEGNVPAGSAAPTPASLANVTVRPTSALIYGVPVTDALYATLQKAQGLPVLPGQACDPNDANGLDYTEACMPNLTKLQVAMLTDGKVNSWSEFRVNYNGVKTLPQVASDATGGAPTTFTVGGVVKNMLPTNLQVHYCKRINGSGTNAQHNVHYLHAPCRKDSSLTDGDWASALGGRQKHEVSSSANASTVVNPSDMEACLTDFANGTNIGRQETPNTNPVTFTTVINPGGTTPPAAPGTTAWAFGQQSLENNPTAAKNYRFVKIDGFAPTLENVFRGRYQQAYEATCQWRNDAPQNIKDIVNKLCTDFARPQILAQELNINFVHPFGASGYLADGNEFAFGDVLNPALPVWPYSHAPDGLALSNCKVPVMSNNFPAVPANKTNRPLRGF